MIKSLVEKGCKKIINVLQDMLKNDATTYRKLESTQSGRLTADYNLNITFLEDNKHTSHWIRKRD